MSKGAEMQTRILWVAGVGAVVMAASPALCAQAPAVTAFEHVSVIPMDRERVLADQTVVVRGQRIVALGPALAVAVPAGAARIDGHGKYLIPGLADMHAHSFFLAAGFAELGSLDSTMYGAPGAIQTAERLLFLEVANGVTTIREMHGFPELLALRDRVARGELIGPRMYVATRALYADYSQDEVLSVARAAKAAGYDLIKLYGIDGALLDSVVAIARRDGLPVAGHSPSSPSQGGVDRAIAVGYASIEHLNGFEPALLAGRQNDQLSIQDTAAFDAKLRELAARLRQAGVWNCPTLSHDRQRRKVRELQRELRYVDPAIVAFMSTVVMHGYNDSVDAFKRRVVKGLQAGGAKLLLGTDAAGLTEIAGFAAHHELAALVGAGLTPYEALVTGTRNVAEFLGTLDSTGTVATNKRADLVLLRANPLADIQNSTKIEGVMVAGRWFSRTELDRRLKAIEGTLTFTIAREYRKFYTRVGRRP